MKFLLRLFTLTLAFAFLTLAVHPAMAAATIWNGPNLNFNKPDGADWTLAANQDCIVPGVCLTRKNTEGLFNISSEAAYTHHSSPSGTEWAFMGLDGNPNSAAAITAANHANLVFNNFEDALESDVGAKIIARPGVLHLIATDVYLNILFNSWKTGEDEGSRGGFFYTRATAPAAPAPTPLPTTLSLMCIGLGGLVVYQLLRRRAVRAQ
jgi:hypothetical protein